MTFKCLELTCSFQSYVEMHLKRFCIPDSAVPQVSRSDINVYFFTWSTFQDHTQEGEILHHSCTCNIFFIANKGHLLNQFVMPLGMTVDTIFVEILSHIVWWIMRRQGEEARNGYAGIIHRQWYDQGTWRADLLLKYLKSQLKKSMPHEPVSISTNYRFAKCMAMIFNEVFTIEAHLLLSIWWADEIIHSMSHYFHAFNIYIYYWLLQWECWWLLTSIQVNQQSIARFMWLQFLSILLCISTYTCSL